MNTVLSADDIRKLLPHRYPFLLIDKIIHLVPGKSGIAIKNVTVNEPYFQGHFPEEMIVPGVLMVECLAQTAAVVYCAEYLEANGLGVDPKSMGRICPGQIAEHVGYLAEIDVKFRAAARPGDQLTLHVTIGKSLGRLSQVKVLIKVENTTVADGKIIVSKRT